MSAVRKQTAVRATSARTLSIGKVLEALRSEFPDVTVSKIRFLESEGLITPQRTASGYRRFTGEDVERLRYILVTQRDNYLPLKVIREQLEAMDAGAVSLIEAEPMVSPENFRAPAPTRLSDEEVASQADVTAEAIAELLDAGLIRPDAAGFFTADDVRIVLTAESLRGFGFDIRHLKSLRNTAQRQADLIGQVAGPVARSQRSSAKEKAADMGQQMTALVVSLHASLVKNALRDELA
ncbi:MerR family transcriptional regulator [Corynebacterium sp.]|uniref:transcriptional regulator FtsR n=1 Tax=Corynebacterium sp. TaxID=1720 RepID=UPI0019986A61|nr:MerR family transcriptional regulator [Corynebacterium sp.]HHU68054.1 MerR family DNA-binding transcriptional regulator [Corynebacterium sp.]HKM24670.1 MerR family transcriptional regulator [Corynebacterium sp.]